MQIDAHQHYWKVNRGDYGWITPKNVTLYRDFLEDDLRPHLIRNNIDKTIVVQAAPTMDETEFILSLSEKSDTIAGVVGWVDVDNSLYKEQLERFSKNPKFVGIRIMIQDMQDEKKILEKNYLDAFSYFADIDIPVDLLVRSDQLPTLAELLDKVSIRGVINHIAKPDIALCRLEPWKTYMKEIAKHPNIYCKLSGMVTEADKSNWKSEHFIPYVRHIIDEFALDRVMFGSDWPVCMLAASYNEVYELLLEIIPDNISAVEKNLVFGGNAIKFYKLFKDYSHT